MDWNTHTSKQSRFGGKKMQKFQIRNSVREKISKPNKKKKSPPIGVSKRLLCVYSDVSVMCGNWLSYVAADRWDLIATTINSDYECLKLCSDDSIMTNKLPSDGVLWNYKDTRRRYWFYGLSLVCETWKTKTRFCHGWLLLPPLLLVAFHVFSIFFFFAYKQKPLEISRTAVSLLSQHVSMGSKVTKGENLCSHSVHIKTAFVHR